jgi:hypothetical protein
MALKNHVISVLAGGLLLMSQLASANTVSYILDVTNIDPLPSGTPYLYVTIDDEGATGDINFTVETVYDFDEGNNFGIQSFGFNNTGDEGIDLIAANLLLPGNWGFVADANQSGFGQFEFTVSTTGSDRMDPLMFSITGIEGDTIVSYTGPSTGNAGHGNAWFAAHLADFGTDVGDGCSAIGVDGCKEITSGWFGGGNGFGGPPASVIPVPAAVWLFGSGLLGLVGVARRSRKA